MGVSELINGEYNNGDSLYNDECDVIWCRSTIETDNNRLKNSTNPVIIITEYSGAEANWLLRETLKRHFSKIIFLTRGRDGSDEDCCYLSLRKSLREIREQLELHIFNIDSESLIQAKPVFSQRENHFLMLVRQGLNVQEIAQSMNISVPTVYSYRRRICHKMEMRHIGEIVKKLNQVQASEQGGYSS